MKSLLPLFILTIAAALCKTSFATILVANNNNPSPGQYSTLQTAINAASNGDTIHIQPSIVVYDGTGQYDIITLNKSLTLIGVGHNPKKDIPYPSRINHVVISGTAASQGVKLIGIHLANFRTSCGAPMNNIHFSHCRMATFGGYSSIDPCPMPYNNCSMSNCYIEVGITIVTNYNGPTTGNNILVNNCVIQGQCQFGNGTNVVVRNCLFLRSSPITVPGILGSGITFENNIFHILGSPNYASGLNNCVFNNNLTYQTLDDSFSYGTGHTLSNNIVGQNPLFVNYTPPANTHYSPIYNFRLQESSPGHNAGTDGMDIGLYGGSHPWSETGEHPDLPVVRSVGIENPVVPSQGTMSVHIKASTFKLDNPE